MADGAKKTVVKKTEVKKKDITEITWEKPNGNRIRTNALDATIEYAVELGWERVEEN